MNKLPISFETYSDHILKLCHDIKNSNWEPDYIVGIVRGGALPAVMVSHYFNKPCYTIKIALRDHADTECNCWMPEDAVGSETDKKNILIIDDINDTGATFEWLKDDWESSCKSDWETVWNHNVKFATVVNNGSSKFKDVDYTAFSIDKSQNDVWIQFPYEDWWLK